MRGKLKSGRRARGPSCSRTPPPNSNLQYIVAELTSRAFSARWVDGVSELGAVQIKAALADEPDPSKWPRGFYREFIIPFELVRDQSFPHSRSPEVERLIDEIAARRLAERVCEAKRQSRRKKEGARRGHPLPRAMIALVVAASQLDECAGLPCLITSCDCHDRVARRLGPGVSGTQIKGICNQFEKARSTGERYVNVTNEILHQLAALISVLTKQRRARALARADDMQRERFYRPQAEGGAVTVVGALSKMKSEEC
jgi:hypothetical protein